MKHVPQAIRSFPKAHEEILDEMMKAYNKMAEAMKEREKDMKDPDLAFNVGYRVGIFQGIGETVVDEIDPDKKKAEKEAIKKENVAPTKAPYVDLNVKGKIAKDAECEIKKDSKVVKSSKISTTEINNCNEN